jgi:uracil phosphoribosyltransferase
MPDNVFPSRHPLVAHKLALLRSTATEPKKFRELVRELSILLACEATQDLTLEPIAVTTPMGQTQGQVLVQDIGLVPVLRAGLGMVEGIWEMLPSAEVWHIGLKRDERTLEPMQYYANKPVAPRVQLCLLLDPMLATGGSASAACTLLKSWGVKRIKYIGLIAAPEGIRRLQTDHPDVAIHVGAVDDHLNEIGYIVPGLGDAGDRQFGTG